MKTGSISTTPKCVTFACSRNEIKRLAARAIALAVALGFGLLVPQPAHAQATLTTLYKFCPKTGCVDGSSPFSGLVIDESDNVYGTTSLGGDGKCADSVGCGTVYEVASTGKHRVLYSFKGVPDGQLPAYENLIRDSKGNLYGTTSAGGTGTCGTGGCGTVFKLNAPTKSGGEWKEKVLYSFKGGTDGQAPLFLAMDAAGNLYGTTETGGSLGAGQVYKVTPSGVKTDFYSFNSYLGDGALANPGVVMDTAGNLYGTTAEGGANSLGAVFKVTPSGTESLLYSFKSGDPSGIQGGLIIDASGSIYGTGRGGGAHEVGAVFKVTSGGDEMALYSFGPTLTDGEEPMGGLVTDSSGNLYGTTEFGGKGAVGTVFKLDTSNDEITVLWNFSLKSGGSEPVGSLAIDGAGNLYGATPLGGSANDAGTVFKLVP